MSGVTRFSPSVGVGIVCGERRGDALSIDTMVSRWAGLMVMFKRWRILSDGYVVMWKSISRMECVYKSAMSPILLYDLNVSNSWEKLSLVHVLCGVRLRSITMPRFF